VIDGDYFADVSVQVFSGYDSKAAPDIAQDEESTYTGLVALIDFDPSIMSGYNPDGQEQTLNELRQ